MRSRRRSRSPAVDAGADDRCGEQALIRDERIRIKGPIPNDKADVGAFGPKQLLRGECAYGNKVSLSRAASDLATTTAADPHSMAQAPPRKIAIVDSADLVEVVDACRSLIRVRFHDDDHHGAAAMLLDDGTILTGTAPDAINPSVEVCHEIEPYCAAFRLCRRILASVCLHRKPGGRTVVLSPCGVCRERLAVYGPNVLVAVADANDPTLVVWKPLKAALPDYWMTAFPDEIDPGWTD
jgi:cytidine deaminase